MIQPARLETAKRGVEECRHRAGKIEKPMVSAITNLEGNLMFRHRGASSWLGSTNISLNKVLTVAALDMPTHESSESARSKKSLYNLTNTNQGRIVLFRRGYPLEVENNIGGTIRSSGSAVTDTGGRI